MPYSPLMVSVVSRDIKPLFWPGKSRILKNGYKRWILRMQTKDGRYVTISAPEGMKYDLFLAELSLLFSYLVL